jgi:gliding motility-associated-like protein
MNDIGCADTAVRQFLMVILDKVLIIPNVFSPNGDGINDRWEIAGLRSVTDCHVEIFDRWGQSIYNSNGYSNPWDGTRKGKPLPVATYYYIIKTATRNYNGWVALVR